LYYRAIVKSGICSEDTSKIVVVDRFFIYNVVSPNGDESNETWYIGGIEQYPNNTVNIFNRWGQLVYSVVGYNNNDRVWDGKSNINGSTNLPEGTYFYSIDIKKRKQETGYVELKR
jgi:gliding motility-associated-like protein